MGTVEFILLLLVAVLLSSVIDQLVPRITPPLIQVALGVILALCFSQPIDLLLNPEIFLLIFVAPLLFDEARHINRKDLWKHRSSVLSLAIGLVLITVLTVGFSLHWIIPSIPLTAAFALGAAIAPTDAVTLTTLPCDIKLTQHQKTLLQGEALINDASGVVSFQFAIAATITGTFSFIEAGETFLISFFGGVAVGVILGFFIKYFVRKIRDIGLESTTFHVLIEIVTPLLVYILAEKLQVSGILAVVAAGLTVSFVPRTMDPSLSQLAIVSTSVWRVLTFTLKGMVFIMLGLKLPFVVQSTWDDVRLDNILLFTYVIALTALLILIRFLWLIITERLHKNEQGKRMPFSKLSFRSILTTSLAGSKGAITLSIAFTIPYFLSSGDPFPERDLLIFLASGIILTTLLLSNLLVPLLAPKAKNETGSAPAIASLTIDILRNVIEKLHEEQTEENAIATQVVIQSYNQRIVRIQNHSSIESESHDKLRFAVLCRQQDFILKKLQEKKINTRIANRYLRRITQMHTLLKQHYPQKKKFLNFLRNLQGDIQIIFLRILNKLPHQKTPEYFQSYRDLQMDTYSDTIAFLQSEINKNDYPTESIIFILMEYDTALKVLEKSTLHSFISPYAHASNKVDEIERKGLQFELEQIQNFYEQNLIARTTAKNLRENVYLMQINLENHL